MCIRDRGTTDDEDSIKLTTYDQFLDMLHNVWFGYVFSTRREDTENLLYHKIWATPTMWKNPIQNSYDTIVTQEIENGRKTKDKKDSKKEGKNEADDELTFKLLKARKIAEDRRSLCSLVANYQRQLETSSDMKDYYDNLDQLTQLLQRMSHTELKECVGNIWL
eukprot:TRINITY_DN13906_c0_g1_i1.p1 TRINITY_DN13906_c0_g1~~TRINITY_DN13906_c0_g1_i1.p1  ORF type:complete len:164 (-),score=42.10 TRINITY_DN13906_c0_g1_i1:81-572(-)